MPHLGAHGSFPGLDGIVCAECLLEGMRAKCAEEHGAEREYRAKQPIFVGNMHDNGGVV